MGTCPICKTSANLEQPTGGDYRRVECRKCGKFQITGTALAILPSRLTSEGEKGVARLSHSTRKMSTASVVEWPEINSMNLDEMLRQPLPSIDRQMTNLLLWAAKQLDDDHLGAVELPDESELTAVIGTIDGRRVDDLVSLTERAGLIEFVPDNCISITPAGWSQLDNPASPTGSKQSQVTETAEKPDDVVKAHCNKCRGDKNSHVRANHTVSGSDGPTSWSETYDVLQCCGCDSLSVRRTFWFSEWDDMDYDDHGELVRRPGIKISYFPPPTLRNKPDWADTVKDEVLRRVLDELYAALNTDLRVLAAVGARTLLDRAGFLLVDDPKGGFEGKLKALQIAGYISPQEKEVLDAMADAGSASAHRGYTPDPERLNSITDIIENFLQRTFVLKGAAEELRKSTPPRKRDRGSE